MVANFNKKQKGELDKGKLAFQVAGTLFLVIIAVLIFADIKIYQKKKELALQIESYKKQIEDIKNSSQNLKDEIANSNNSDYIEKIAYEQLDEQRPGEKEIIFTTPPAKTAVTTSKPANFWNAWLGGALNWLKSKF